MVLQYLLGLRRMKKRGIWLEVLRTSGDPAFDNRLANTFRRRLAEFGLENNFCLLIDSGNEDEMNVATSRVLGLKRRELLDLLAGPNTLLNLSYSIRQPFIQHFERRILCSLDPTEVCFWMQRVEMGQSHHHEFTTIGLNTGSKDSRVPVAQVTWRTFFPLVDTAMFKRTPRPPQDTFSTVGQWYWDGSIQWDGEWRDFSKKAAFEKFLLLPKHMTHADWVLAMNLNDDDPEIKRLTAAGWKFCHPHQVARTPRTYYQFLANSTAEFSAVKLESYARSGWLSDRSAVYLAMGRPVITESTGAERYLPEHSGMAFVGSMEEAVDAAHSVTIDWHFWSCRARACAVEYFDSVKNLKKILA